MGTRGREIVGIDVNDPKSPVLVAASSYPNPIEIFKLLLDAGANAKAIGENGKTVLEYAAQNSLIKNSPVFQRLKDAAAVP